MADEPLIRSVNTQLGDPSTPRSNSAPSLYTEERGIIDQDSSVQHMRRLTAPQITRVAVLGLLLHIIIGVTVFTFASEGFKGHKTVKLIDAIYFTIVTLSTVGYGDIVPSTTFTKLFTCFFILAGFGIIGTMLINGLVTFVLDRQEDFDKKKVRMGLTFGVVILSIVTGTAALHFMEDLAWVDSFYVSVTSVTTVGNGDYAFETPAGRCFAIIWLLTSTLAVARSFLYLVDYRIEKRNQRTANLALQKKCTVEDLVAADWDNDGSISIADYVVYRLKEMGKIQQRDMYEICKQFDTMASPDDNKITIADLIGDRGRR